MPLSAIAVRVPVLFPVTEAPVPWVALAPNQGRVPTERAMSKWVRGPVQSTLSCTDEPV